MPRTPLRFWTVLGSILEGFMPAPFLRMRFLMIFLVYMGPKGALFYIKIIKSIKIAIFQKSGLGAVVIQFWIRIRILHEKLYILLGSSPFFIDFWKSDFRKIQLFVIFLLLGSISTYFGIAIKRALKKYAYCPIFIIFGWNTGPYTPKQHLESSSAIRSILNPSSWLIITIHYRSLLIITNLYRSLLIITNHHRSLLIMINH